MTSSLAGSVTQSLPFKKSPVIAGVMYQRNEERTIWKPWPRPMNITVTIARVSQESTARGLPGTPVGKCHHLPAFFEEVEIIIIINIEKK